MRWDLVNDRPARRAELLARQLILCVTLVIPALKPHLHVVKADCHERRAHHQDDHEKCVHSRPPFRLLDIDRTVRTRTAQPVFVTTTPLDRSWVDGKSAARQLSPNGWPADYDQSASLAPTPHPVTGRQGCGPRNEDPRRAHKFRTSVGASHNRPRRNGSLGGCGRRTRDRLRRHRHQPDYAFRTVFNPRPRTPCRSARDNVFGILSLIFWSLMIIVTLKYVIR